MGIESKHTYRFGYLRSEEWKSVRLEALARDQGCCSICCEYSASNDAHHLSYPSNIYDTKASDLVILCRSCHDLIHDLLKIHQIKSHTKIQFIDICNSLRKWRKNKMRWTSPDRKTAPEKKSKRCRYCLQETDSVEIHDMFGNGKYYFEMCADCKRSNIALVSSLGDSVFKHYKIYEGWKKSRKLLV